MPICIDHTAYTPTFFEEFRHPHALPVGGRLWDTWLTWGRTTQKNGELQFYVTPDIPGPDGKSLGINPFSIGNELLAITAAATPTWARPSVGNLPYTSGVITTRHSFSQTYGYFEINAQMPRGKGLWPAFWMLPVNGYPPEIDIVEVLGASTEVVHQTVHPLAGTANGSTYTGIDSADGLHNYGVKWTKAEIAFTVDGQITARFPNTVNQPMYLLVNLAVGGWAGAPDATTQFPASMKIEYVRAYREDGTTNCAR